MKPAKPLPYAVIRFCACGQRAAKKLANSYVCESCLSKDKKFGRKLRNK